MVLYKMEYPPVALTADAQTLPQDRCQQIARDLHAALAGSVHADRLTRAIYSTDASIYQILPAAVVLPANGDDILTTLHYAAQNHLSVIPRGAGSGLAGEAVGSGIVIDFSRHLNRLINLDLHANQVSVEPGIVLEQLNRQLAHHHKQIGPDPASGNRATIGGMIANNATGAHSLKFGYTSNHLQCLNIITADAQNATVTRQHLPQNNNGPAAAYTHAVHSLLAPHRDLLDRAKPTTDRNGSGYNIFAALAPDNSVNLAELLAGSEGTLALVTQATFNLVDLPPCKMLLQLNFPSLAHMARAVPHLLQLTPAACELMDRTLLTLARKAYPQYHDVLPDTAASLLVEFDGPDPDALEHRLQQAQKFARQLPHDARPDAATSITSPQLQQRVWAARKAATPLLYRDKGPAQPIPIIEDIAVNPDQLAQYLARLHDITTRLNVPVAYYAHAGHGELHTRPFLNLHLPEHRRKLQQLADEVFNLVWSLGGTISGEHGEGLVRASFVPKQYGPEITELFRQLKHIFDPHNLLNPGKIINDDPDVLTKNLRFDHNNSLNERPTNLIFRDDELTREIEQCNGNGLCRSADPTLSMCPIFRATGDELASPRAKANLMRHWLHGLLDEDLLASQEFRRVADLCVNCKSCARECPSLVNIPKLMLEARAEYVRRNGLSRPQHVLTRSEFMSRFGAAFAPIANPIMRSGPFRRFLELAAQLDRRRPLPPFNRGNNIRKLRRHLRRVGPVKKPIDKVAYFVDLYATYNDHALGRAVVDLLRHCRVDVIIPPQRSAAMPPLTYGHLAAARPTAAYNIAHLAHAVRQGYKIIASEPTAALCLKEEYLDLIDSDDARLVADNTFELTDYLARLARADRLPEPPRPLNLTIAYHTPCHYAALDIPDGTAYLLSRIQGLSLEPLPKSCCGIAGTFGFQKKNYDLSLRAGQPVLDALRNATAPLATTECATCKMQLEQTTGKTVLHPAKLLAIAYGLLDPSIVPRPSCP